MAPFLSSDSARLAGAWGLLLLAPTGGHGLPTVSLICKKLVIEALS